MARTSGSGKLDVLSKGTLVIDGAPSTIGIVPFYVVNNSGSAVNMTTDGYTGSDMKVFYETTESGYWTNASTATVEVKNNNYSKLESLEAKDIQVSMERIMNIRIKIQIRKLRKKVTIIL